MKLAVVPVLLLGTIASAGVVQVPEGGKPVPALVKGVVCGPLAGGWAFEGGDRRMIVPPASGTPNMARTFDVKIADTLGGCAASKQNITLVALGPWPDIDPTAVTFWPDDGRIELRGQRLKGVQVSWSVAGDDAKHGSDMCLDASTGPKVQSCTIPLQPGLPADAQLNWVPPFGHFGEDVVTFDALGNRVDRDALRLRPARTVLSHPLVQTSGVDVTGGPARVVLSHPEAVASVDCGTATCELADKGVTVRAVPDPSTQVTLHLHLAPRVVATKGDAFETVVTTAIPLLSCPMTVIAGTVVRDVDETSAVVRLDPRCGRDPNNLRWVGGGDQAEVKKVVKASDGIYVWLHLERVSSEHVTITASRPDLDNTIVASATAKPISLAQPHVALELVGHGKIDFVPTNRPARVIVSPTEIGRLVPVPIDGAYSVNVDGGVTTIRAADSAEGFVSLRLGYRIPSLPGELAIADLAIITERVQRELREAAVPATIGASAYTPGEAALVELLCGDEDGNTHQVRPGQLYRIPWIARGSCRIVLHRERLSAADGSQEIQLDVDVSRADGTPRPEDKLSEHMVLRPGAGSRVVPIKGTLDEFDHIDVRVSHVIDESRYVVSNTAPSKPGLLAAQWSAIVDGGRFRLYATATIPAGLYRVNHPSGQLTLNFGVLSRLTTLNRQGKEGLFGLEFGVMGLGLAPQSSNIQFPLTLAVVSGIGFRVPLGQGAAIGIQAWAAYEFRDGSIQMRNPDGSLTNVSAGPWSFIFGPSISFGNVGLNL
jgi:hypothetical protein